MTDIATRTPFIRTIHVTIRASQKTTGDDPRFVVHVHLDMIALRIQGIGAETTESILKDEVAALVAGLMRDTEKMTAS